MLITFLEIATPLTCLLREGGSVQMLSCKT